MPGDLSAIAQSFVGVLISNAEARDALSSAMQPQNDERGAAVINQYTTGASIDASDVATILPLIAQALADARSKGITNITGTVVGADEGEDPGSGAQEGLGMTVVGIERLGESGTGQTVVGGDEGAEPPDEDPNDEKKPEP